MKQNVHDSLKRSLVFAFLFLYALGVAAYSIEVDGIAYNFIDEKEVEVTKKTEGYSGVIVIPETVKYNGKSYSVTKIGGGGFWGCSALASVTIPKSVTRIGEMAFRACSRLTSVKLPDNIINIEEMAFYSSGLTSIEFPKSLKEIRTRAFAECSKLTSVTFSESLTSIGDNAFDGCSNISLIVLPKGLDSIGSEAFRYCSELSFITISNSVKHIGYGAFSKCRALTSVTLPAGVTSVENFLFEDCSKLTSVTFPAGVTNFGISVFSGCIKLSSIKVASAVPATTSEQTFDNFNRTLYVPTGSREAYAEHAVWGKFKNIVEYDLSALPGVSASGESGIVLTSPAPGSLMIHCAKECSAILQRVDGTTLMPLTLSEGENRVDGLAPGLYLVGGQKVVVQ